MKKLSLAVLAIISFSAEVSAREFADIYTDCGLGAMIAPNNDVVAAITNVTWDLGTTAISSNASSEENCAGGKETTASIIFQTYPALEQNIASGSGEYLTAVLQSSGCDESVQASMIHSLRGDLSAMVTGANYANQSRFQNSENLYNAVMKSAEAHACKSA